MKKPIGIALGIILFVLVIGIIIPKVAIKNPNLSSSPCAQMSVKAASKFPLSLLRTAKVERFNLASVDISFYTLFGIKLKHQTGVNCLLIGSAHTWTKYENTKLGFSLEYPSDLLKPQEGGQDEPGNISFIKDRDSYEKIQVDVTQTNFADIWSYMAKNPISQNSTTTKVNDFPAIATKDSNGPCPDCVNYLLFAQGNQYILSIDLPASDAARVVDSFRVAIAPPMSPNWPISPPTGTGLLYMRTIDGKAHVFYNGVDLDPQGSFGQVSQQIAQDGHLAQVFLTHIGPPRYQITYDGQIVKPDFDASGYPEIAISGDHFAYTDGGSPNATIFYDGKDAGSGNNLRLSGDHYVYTRNISSGPAGETHVVYDGKDLGSCCNGRFGGANASDDHLVHTGQLSQSEADSTYSTNSPQYISHVIVDGKDIGAIKSTSWPQFSGSHMAYIKANGDLMYDNKKIAEKVRDVKLSGDNIIYVTDSSDVYFNSKKLGQGNYIQLDGNDYIHLKMIKDFSQAEEPLCNVIFNGKDMGQSTECRVSLFKGNTVFQRVINGLTHMILNGQDIGEGEGAQLVNPLRMPVNIACQNYHDYNFSISCGPGLYLNQYLDGGVIELTFFDKNRTYWVEGSNMYIMYIGITRDTYHSSIDEYLQGHSSQQLVKQTTVGGQTAYNLTCKPHMFPCENDSVVFYKGNTYLFTNADNGGALPTYNKLISSVKFD